MADPQRALSWPTLWEMEKIPASLRQKLLAQLEKDLQQPFDFTEASALLEELGRVVVQRTEAGKLQELLYRVDLPESIAHQCLDAPSPAGCLALAILKREAQKVLFRWQYGGSGDGFEDLKI